MSQIYSLSQLGWQHFFQQQLSLDEWEQYQIARVEALERSKLFLLTVDDHFSIPIISSMPSMTVGDWGLLNQSGQFFRLLDRLSLFSRKSAGTKVATQLIAANVDTVFIVSSLNQDFNLNRIERYLALANEVKVEPVIILTKSDCCENTQDYVQQVQNLNSLINVIAVNSLDSESVMQLTPWCNKSQTVTFLGSSGVGKSTLINTLLDDQTQRTNAIREDDDKGRHTTTRRTLHLLKNGGILIDTPGMRELQLANCESGVEETFSEITELARQCKYSDCQHEDEPDCAVKEAIVTGVIDRRRLINYQKLLREQEFNSATLAENRARDRKFSRYIRSVQSQAKKIKRGE
ncbi:MAG: ribosome small subunit-dependent GTPase A [Gammaproteobacteria bacterium]|nr:ribosome small subunit-dependent GTPase A [Gammaproteobacteria bacterium]